MTAAPRVSLEGELRNAVLCVPVLSGHGDSALGSNFHDSVAGHDRVVCGSGILINAPKAQTLLTYFHVCWRRSTGPTHGTLPFFDVINYFSIAVVFPQNPQTAVKTNLVRPPVPQGHSYYDYAGGGVVHLAGGVAALVRALKDL